ncbi:M48 family metallopeptidase [Candidatus Saccharibacteria bacterium]|nr:M48 family metallopeptidase [Candidatus Saccharibacteria bacterium]
MQNKFCYGSRFYVYHLSFEDRKSLSLVVYPNCNIAVKAPAHATEEKIEGFLRRKWVWLEKQLAEFEKYKKAQYTRKYLAGESMYYLGRQYILDIVTGKQDCVKKVGGKIQIISTKSIVDSEYNELLLKKWLDNRRNEIYKKQLVAAWEQFGYERIPQIKIREMSQRWGSCSKNGKVITLNPKLIEAPMEAIRYVCIHELSHIKHLDHDTAFYRLMESHLPNNWRSIKDDLEIRFG